MASFTTRQPCHNVSNSCWVLLELIFVASAVITRVRKHCYGHVAHGTSQLHTSVRSLCDLHSLGPLALGCVNSVETCTSVNYYNLQIMYIMYMYNVHSIRLYYNSHTLYRLHMCIQDTQLALYTM